MPRLLTHGKFLAVKLTSVFLSGKIFFTAVDARPSTAEKTRFCPRLERSILPGGTVIEFPGTQLNAQENNASEKEHLKITQVYAYGLQEVTTSLFTPHKHGRVQFRAPEDKSICTYKTPCSCTKQEALFKMIPTGKISFN